MLPNTSDAHASNLFDATERARLSRVGDFSRWHQVSKSFVEPFQRRSSTESKTGTSSLKVARVRNSNASFHAPNNDSDNARAFRIEGCHSRQSLGISSRWKY